MDTVTDPGPIEEMDQVQSLEQVSSITIATQESVSQGSDILQDKQIIAFGDKRVIALRTLLQNDIYAADVKWSLFVAACQHYRWDSCLKPFPPDYIVNGTKDIDALLRVVDSISSLVLLSKYLQDDELHLARSEVVDLAHWVLLGSKDVRLVSVTKPNHNSVLARVPSEAKCAVPNWIFQVTSKGNVVTDQLWEGREKLFAYHGSRLENFYSILQHGLQQHLNKNSLYGQGVYLSSELSVSLPYSPMGYSWGGSIVGNQLSCVALCEMADHPDVRCQENGSKVSVDRNRALTQDSEGGEIPHKYYVVRNSDLVRVKYLLVYSKKQPLNVQASNWAAFAWLRRHKTVALVVAYMTLLAAIGLANNDQLVRYIKQTIHNLKKN